MPETRFLFVSYLVRVFIKEKSLPYFYVELETDYINIDADTKPLLKDIVCDGICFEGHYYLPSRIEEVTYHPLSYVEFYIDNDNIDNGIFSSFGKLAFEEILDIAKRSVLIKPDKRVCCTDCKHFGIREDETPFCINEYKCELRNPEDSFPFKYRPYWERRDNMDV